MIMPRDEMRILAKGAIRTQVWNPPLSEWPRLEFVDAITVIAHDVVSILFSSQYRFPFESRS